MNGPVFLCPGQGSQKPGMGADLVAEPNVAAVLACASDVFGQDIAALVSTAPKEVLDETRNAQVALCALSIGLARACEARGVTPSAVLGFSLGQIAALAIAGMLSDEDAFALVLARADAMEHALEERPGAMTAFLKVTQDEALELCATCASDDVLVPANYNCPGQIVLSGDVAAIERAEESWRSHSGRLRRLATAGAFHSPLMAKAADELDAHLAKIHFAEARVPLICNVDAKPLRASRAREHLRDHLTHPVLFQQSLEQLAKDGATTYAELGCGGVLVGLVKRIDPTAQRFGVKDLASLDAFIQGAKNPSEPS